MPNNLKRVLIVGTGEIASEYCKVLKSMDICPDVVGREENKARLFADKYSVEAFGGGIKDFYLKYKRTYDYAIIAVDILSLAEVTCFLCEQKIPKILVEKPAGISREEIESIVKSAKVNHTEVYVAYNRRFYSSVEKAKEIIKEDGGVSSLFFEFTEWSHVIRDLNTSSKIKEEWFLANSTHVVDTAFYLVGKPITMNCFTSGSLDWHSKGSVYTGSGLTDLGVLFAYHANWEAPGRWAIEILTGKHRLYLKPMEKLAIQCVGSVSVETVDIEDTLDRNFKPGFWKEVEAFIFGDRLNRLKTIKEQLEYLKFYECIEKGGTLNY